jgi:hypothetical protein
MEAAECLAAIAAVVEQVALLLHQHAALVAGQEADGEVIGERAGGEPDGGFLAEGVGHGLFELGDHPANGVFVGFDGGGEFLEERGVLRWGVVDAVAVGLDRGASVAAERRQNCGGDEWGRRGMCGGAYVAEGIMLGRGRGCEAPRGSQDSFRYRR